MEIIMTGEPVSAQKLHSLGLFSELVGTMADKAPAQVVRDRAIALAQKIAANSAPVVAFAKQAIKLEAETSYSAGLAHGI